MDAAVTTIPLARLLIGFVPVVLLLGIMHLWSLNALHAVYANARMLIQLLAIGYVLTYVLETDRPWVVVAVVAFMIAMSAWIALRPIAEQRPQMYLIVLITVGTCGLGVLLLVTQLVLDMPRWFEPRFVVPLAGMIFANTMNTVSLAAERFRSEVLNHGGDGDSAVAYDAVVAGPGYVAEPIRRTVLKRHRASVPGHAGIPPPKVKEPALGCS